MGIGVSGFIDMLCLMRIPIESQSAREINIKIFETIYYAAVTKSIELAKLYGPFPSYEGSPTS
jgi:ribonucleoside-diphosphate reductase subunit M1